MDSSPPADNQQNRFDTVRRGYDTAQVDDYVGRLEDKMRLLKDELKAAEVKIQSLHKKLAVSRDTEEEVGAAYLAAAEAKQRLLDNARQKADEIIAAAEGRARKLAGTDTGQRVADAEEEAKRIVHEAQAEAQRLTTRARTEAMSAVGAAQREIEALLERNRNKHLHLIKDLHTLKEAVDDAVARAERDGRVLRTRNTEEPTVVEI